MAFQYGFGTFGGGHGPSVAGMMTAALALMPLVGAFDEETGSQIFVDPSTGEEYTEGEVVDVDPQTGAIRGKRRGYVKRAGRRAAQALRGAVAGSGNLTATFGGLVLPTASVAGNAAMGALATASVNNETLVDRLQIQVIMQPNAAALTPYTRHLIFTDAFKIQAQPTFDPNAMVVPASSAGPRWTQAIPIHGGPRKIPANANVFNAGTATLSGGAAAESYVVLFRLLRPGDLPETN